MKRTDLPAPLQELLKHTLYVTIATVCPGGQPWNTPVVGAFDDQLHLYWVSWKESQHSRNVAQEPRIFAVVYDSQAQEGQGVGLYLQMQAHELGAAELPEAQKIYDPSFFRHNFTHDQFLTGCPQRIYKAIPEHIWYNIAGKEKGHFVDKRAELTAK